MSRTTKAQSYNPGRPRKFTKAETFARFQREVRRRLKADGLLVTGSQRPKMDWHWHYVGEVEGFDERKVLLRANEVGGVVAANTRSEARAQIKKYFGGKLPAGLTIVGVKPDANSPFQPGTVEVSAVQTGGDSNDLRAHGENDG